MSRQPVLVDLFCKAGGATKGYWANGCDLYDKPRHWWYR